MDSESIAHGSRYISRSKPKIPFQSFHGLFLLRNQTETLAQAIHDSIPFPLAVKWVYTIVLIWGFLYIIILQLKLGKAIIKG